MTKEKIHSGKVVLNKTSEDEEQDRWHITCKVGNVGFIHMKKSQNGDKTSYNISSYKINNKEHTNDILLGLSKRYGKVSVSPNGKEKEIGSKMRLQKSIFSPAVRIPGHVLKLQNGICLEQRSSTLNSQGKLKAEWKVSKGDMDLGSLLVQQDGDGVMIVIAPQLKLPDLSMVKKQLASFYSRPDSDFMKMIHANVEKMSDAIQYFPASKGAKIAGLLRVLRPLIEDMKEQQQSVFDDQTPASALRRFNQKWWHVLVAVDKKIPLTQSEAAEFEADRVSLKTALNGLSPENVPPHITTFATIME